MKSRYIRRQGHSDLEGDEKDCGKLNDLVVTQPVKVGIQKRLGI
jgi:hypothetical protein